MIELAAAESAPLLPLPERLRGYGLARSLDAIGADDRAGALPSAPGSRGN
jgi:hypothetical protein